MENYNQSSQKNENQQSSTKPSSLGTDTPHKDELRNQQQHTATTNDQGSNDRTRQPAQYNAAGDRDQEDLQDERTDTSSNYDNDREDDSEQDSRSTQQQDAFDNTQNTF